MPTTQIKPTRITLRIPGLWGNRAEFEESLPQGYALHGDGSRLVTPLGEVEFGVDHADDQLADLMKHGCKHPPSESDLAIIDNHVVKVFLSLEGGTALAATKMLRVGAAILQAAGGGGVFVDNSGISHSSSDWFDLERSAGDGGEYWAYVGTTGGKKHMWTAGMHVLGYRDAVIKRSDDQECDYFMLHNFLGYSYKSGRTLHDGDVFGDPFSPWFRAYMVENTYIPKGSPMHNPYGLWRLEMVEPDEDLTPQSLRN